ncbi:MAG: ABC transporter substrate-binding protein [Candidatus Competibacterales bacterium]
MVGCGEVLSPAQQRRAQIAAETGDIPIALVWPQNFNTSYLRGAALAIAEINAEIDAGTRTLRGDRKLRAQVFDSDPGGRSQAEVGYQIASRIVSHSAGFVAVFGHGYSDIAIPASVLYDEAGILLISPGAYKVNLTRHGFLHVFRTAPTTEVLSTNTALAMSVTSQRVAVLYATRSGAREELALAFEDAAVELGLEIPYFKSYSPTQRDLRPLFADIATQRVDGIFIAGNGSTRRLAVQQGRDLGLTIPFYYPDPIDVVDYYGRLGDRMRDVYAPVLFNPQSQRPEVQAFIRNYRARYDGENPDNWAAQGYDVVQLYAHVVEMSGSVAPLTLANTMRFTLSWRGVTGRHSFTRSGDVYTKILDFAAVDVDKDTDDDSERLLILSPEPEEAITFSELAPVATEVAGP